MNLKKIERIASQLQKQICGQETEHKLDESTLADQIDERTEEEKEKAENLPEPSIQASEEEVKEQVKVEEQEVKEEPASDETKQEDAEDKEQSQDEIEDDEEISQEYEDQEQDEEKEMRIAKLQRLIKLAKNVKKSTKMTAEQKKDALKKIEQCASYEKKAKDHLKIKKQDLNKLLNGDVTKLMKQTNNLNKIIRDQKNEGITLNKAVKEMKQFGKENDIDVDFPSNILNKTIGSCNASWLIQLGPMIANMLKKYEEMKAKAVKKDTDNK